MYQKLPVFLKLFFVIVSVQVLADLEDCSAWNASIPPIGTKCEAGWLRYVERLNQEINFMDKIDVLFVGDSIFESLQGTCGGSYDCIWCEKDTVENFEKYVQNKGWNTFLLAISGDQTGHLLWRLYNGHLERNLESVQFTFLLVGTNDLHFVALEPTAVDPNTLVNSVVTRIGSIVKELQKAAPNSRVIVMGLLPRGNATVEQFFVPETVRQDNYVLPNVYSSYIDNVNNQLAKLHGQNFLQCGEQLLDKDGNVNSEMMKDTVHPTAVGWKSLQDCIDNYLQQLSQKQEL